MVPVPEPVPEPDYVALLIEAAKDVHMPIDPTCEGCRNVMLRIHHLAQHIPAPSGV